MKSLFSCFPKKKSKSKTRENNKSAPLLISESKPNDTNHCEDEIVKKVNHSTENNISHENDLLVIEKDLIIVNEDENNVLFEERLVNASNRIENVFNVLNDKNRMYNLPDAIIDLKNLVETELKDFIVQSTFLGGFFIEQSSILSELFSLQLDLLLTLQNRNYTILDFLHDRYQRTIGSLNLFCSKEDDNYLLNRFIADSIMVFGWVCCFSKPSTFVQNVLDGTVLTGARLVNDLRYSTYGGWVKSWSRVLKAFYLVIARHFEAALMWRLSGPVPMDILKCLVQLNYSNIKEESLPTKIKPKIVKTTAVDDISYETVTNLFDDLRSGKQRSKLKSVKREKAEMEEVSDIRAIAIEEAVEIKVCDSVSEDPTEAERPYTFQGNTWTIRQQVDNADIEVPNKRSGNSVLISDCHRCSIQIDGALLNVTIENSSHVNVIVEDIGGLLRAADSEFLEAQVLGSLSRASLARVDECLLFLTKAAAAGIELDTRLCGAVDLYVAKTDEGGLELGDYEKHRVSNRWRSNIVDGAMRHSLL